MIGMDAVHSGSEPVESGWPESSASAEDDGNVEASPTGGGGMAAGVGAVATGSVEGAAAAFSLVCSWPMAT